MKTVWRVYLLVCNDGTYYCGSTTDVTRRLREHNAGKGAKYTRSRLPVRLVAQSGPMAKGVALSMEAAIKKKPRGLKPGAVRAV